MECVREMTNATVLLDDLWYFCCRVDGYVTGLPLNLTHKNQQLFLIGRNLE